MVEALHYKNQPREDEVSLVKGKYGGDGGGEGPFVTSSPSSSNGVNGNSSKKSSPTHNEFHEHKSLFKLDVKFDLHVYYGELDAKKLDN